MVTPSSSISMTSGDDSLGGRPGGKIGYGLPYTSNSLASLLAAAWIGMPVQWKPKGNKTFFPSMRLKCAAKIAFVKEKAWPMCSRPFMYGYGKVHMNFSLVLSGASHSKICQHVRGQAFTELIMIRTTGHVSRNSESKLRMKRSRPEAWPSASPISSAHQLQSAGAGLSCTTPGTC